MASSPLSRSASQSRDDGVIRQSDGLELTTTSTNGKRKAAGELDREEDDSADERDEGYAEDELTAPAVHGAQETGAGGEDKPLSKNALKRLKRQKLWEDRKEDRKLRRKEKRHTRQARKHAAREAKLAEAEAAGLDRETALQALRPPPGKHRPVPVAIIIDCDFEAYMRENEIVSLSSQIVRSYAENRKAGNQAHLLVSSFKGLLKTRFETVLDRSHENWRGVHLVEGDFVEAATLAQEVMRGKHGGDMIDLLRPAERPTETDSMGSRAHDGADSTPASKPVPEPEPTPAPAHSSIVYLTSDSPYTLDRLEANTSYVVGGLVDRNREKGLCYKRARERNVRTAKLPIGEYMAMQSRHVLTTNQVVEIMAKWLDCGDWAEAFMAIIPKRKGGTIKGDPAVEDEKDVDGEDDNRRPDEDVEAIQGGTDLLQEAVPPKNPIPLPDFSREAERRDGIVPQEAR